MFGTSGTWEVIEFVSCSLHLYTIPIEDTMQHKHTHTHSSSLNLLSSSSWHRPSLAPPPPRHRPPYTITTPRRPLLPPHGPDGSCARPPCGLKKRKNSKGWHSLKVLNQGGLSVQVHCGGEKKVINKGLKVPFELTFVGGEQKPSGKWAARAALQVWGLLLSTHTLSDACYSEVHAHLLSTRLRKSVLSLSLNLSASWARIELLTGRRWHEISRKQCEEKEAEVYQDHQNAFN